MATENYVVQRGAIKGKVTRFRKFIENRENHSKIAEIRERIKKFELLDQEYEAIDEKVMTSTTSGSETLQNIERDRELFDEEYFRLLAAARVLIGETNNEITNEVRESSVNVVPSPTISNNETRPIVKQLPPIAISKFDGNLGKWIKFRDSFNSLVHSQSSLSSIDKFNYLNNALEGEAARAIQSLGISDANYEHAWKKLLDRYENPEDLIEFHSKGLCEIPIMTKGYVDLRRIIDDAENHIAALESLGERPKECASILIYLLSKKLDDETKRPWERRAFAKLEKRTFKDFIDTLESYCKYLQRVRRETTAQNEKNQSKKNVKAPRDRFTVHASTVISCPECKGAHAIYACNQFKALSIPARIERVKELKLCFKCLKAGHRNSLCNFGPCKKCNRHHNSLLHLEMASQNERTVAINDNEFATTMIVQSPGVVASQVLLGTAVVEVSDRYGNTYEGRALLDSGSQVHFITKEFCDKLRLKPIRSSMTVTGIQQMAVNLNYKTIITIKSKTTKYETKISCIISPKITENMPSPAIKGNHIKIPAGIQLADPRFNDCRPVDILIGAGLFWDLLCVGQIKSGRDQPFWQKTKLGWIVTGNFQPEESPTNSVCHATTAAQIDEQLEKFWKLEECHTKSGAPALDERDPCEQHFKATTRINAEGRFIVSLPFNEKKDKLGDSYAMAYKRLIAMENKFEKFQGLKNGYHAFMEEYENLGHMTKISQNEIERYKHSFYLPHHAVFKAQSTTTKLRVVFDGSSKTTTGVTLNETQYAGYEVQDELMSILIRFRKHNIVLAADITKMYRQVLVDKNDRKYQLILWREDPSMPVQTYELNTVTYGTRAGAFLAKRCLRQIGEENKENFGKASQVIINDFYVDDLLTGANNLEEARQLKQELTQILAKYGMELRKWASNEIQVFEDENNNELDIQIDKDPKTLGLKWMYDLDKLTITINPPDNLKITKRTILSLIAQVFDPLGLVAPVTVRAKLILQKLWQLQLDWDETVPQDIHTAWSEFHHTLTELNKIKIPRRVLVENYKRIELHGFSDASEAAYGACIYVRSVTESGKIVSQLLCAKTKVAPLKQISLPKLELCAALLLAKLTDKSLKAFDLQINTFLWSDSKITLAWIKGQPNKWKTFVANRVTEIQELTNNNWFHVRSEENPADLVSRGIDTLQLAQSRLWWYGPAWLSQHHSTWQNATSLDDFEVPEKRNSAKTVATVIVKNKFDLIERYSSWMRLLRVTAYCLKFIRIIRNKGEKSVGTYLTPQELKLAKERLIKLAQTQAFEKELRDLKKDRQVTASSKLVSLNPFLDSQGILRVGGRLQKAPIEFEQKHPIILPAYHHISWLIIDYEHKRLFHAGCQAVMASLRINYWPISARNMVKKIVKKCVTCVRWRGATIKTIMGSLPSARVSPTRPFFVSGVDYAGPVFLKEKTRSKITLKAYICIFICFSTKAVHVELAHDLTTEAFLNCLRRFVSRRGRCQKLYSDNGLNFVGARNELNELGCLLNDKQFREQVSSYALKEGIEWHMNPPYAPHFGGLWESAVKSLKFHLKRIIGETRLTYEGLYTVLVQIEACLNSRPLCPISTDPNDLTPLTPGHFLLGEPPLALPEADVRDIAVSRLGKYQQLQFMVQHFWKRWQSEYLHELQQRMKWSKNYLHDLKPGAMVILKDDNLPPTRWRLGRIAKTHPGSDNRVRVVSIQTADGVVKRPIVKIVLLPTDEKEEEAAED